MRFWRQTWRYGALWVCLHLGVGLADGGPPWNMVSTGKWTIKMRAVPGTPAKDFWVEGEMAAPVQDIQNTLIEHERFPSFMPLVKESRSVGKVLDDGSIHVYTRVEPPVVANRDYVVRVYLVESVREDGSGNFHQKWNAVTDLLAERANIVRLKINEGSWYVSPVGDGSRSWVIYKFRTEAGGWIPPWLSDMANKSGLSDTFVAVEKEAVRRKKERLTHMGR